MTLTVKFIPEWIFLFLNFVGNAVCFSYLFVCCGIIKVRNENNKERKEGMS